MLIDAALFSTQNKKVRIKGKMEQFSVVAIEKGAFGLPLTKVTNFTYLFIENFSHQR